MGIFFLSVLFTAILVFSAVFVLFKYIGSVKNPARGSKYWLTAIISTLIFYIGFLAAYFYVTSSYEKKVFDNENWTENRDSRYEQVDDLIENEKLIGLTGSEIKSMLGEADYKDDSTMIFYIGYSPKHFLNMDPDWLEAELIDGKVSNVYVRE